MRCFRALPSRSLREVLKILAGPWYVKHTTGRTGDKQGQKPSWGIWGGRDLADTTRRPLASKESLLARGCLRILEDVCLFDFDDNSSHLLGKLFSCISEVERVVWPRLS